MGKYPIKDFCESYLMALCGRPIRWPSREPVAYLYGHIAKEGETPTHTINGVDYVGAVLPKLPETDLPYAVLRPSYTANGKVLPPTLLCSSAPWTGDALGDIVFYSTEGTDIIKAEYDGMAWGEFVEARNEFYEPPVWANHDVLWLGDDNNLATADGADLLACDPVPVYE